MADGGILERRSVAKGDFIIKQGQNAIEAYLIQSGEVVVFTTAGEKRVELTRLGVGQIFGEMALVSDKPRTASVQALSECNLIVITRKTLQEKLQKSDPTVRALLTMLMKRLEQSNKAQLRKGGSLDDMIEMLPAIYSELNSTLPVQLKKSLELSVKAPMDAFIKAIEDFRQRYDLK